MPDGTFDPVDPMEPALRRRVREFSDQAVVPVDAGEIARTAVRVGRPRFGALSSQSLRLGGIAAAGLLVGVLAGPTLIGSLGIPPTSTGASPASSQATPASGTPACTPNDVDAVMSAWDGAAGSRIGTVILRNTGGRACTMWRVSQPVLTTDGSPLIAGDAGNPDDLIEIGSEDVLQTSVSASNYCGPEPDAPVTVMFVQRASSSDAATFVATALSPTDLSGVPPCNGETEPASIEMQPWQVMRKV